MFGALADRLMVDWIGLDTRTSMYLRFDLRRLFARLRHHRRPYKTGLTRLHVGCGSRKVAGWLNCDIVESDFDIDLAANSWPFEGQQFEAIVAQQTIEHFDFDPVGLRIMRECYRIMKPGGRIWLSCPDLAKMCRAYEADRCTDLDRGLMRHSPAWRSESDFPTQHRINYYFHQDGEHRNLLDFDLLNWGLARAGFVEIHEATDAEMRQFYPEFPEKDEPRDSILVAGKKP